MRYMLLVLFTCVTFAAFAQEPKVEPKSEEKIFTKGRLPSNWSKLGLSDDQKIKIYTIQGNSKIKIEELEKQIADLKAKQKQEMIKILTEEQKQKLLEMLGIDKQ